MPTSFPTPQPTVGPSPQPTTQPTPQPSPLPTYQPTPSPTEGPTPFPSPLPTMMPSFNDATVVTAAASVTLGGFNSPSEFTEDHKTAFKESVAASSSSIASSDQIIGINATMARRRRLEDSTSSSSSLQVQFSVQFILESLGYRAGENASDVSSVSQSLVGGFASDLVSSLNSSDGGFVSTFVAAAAERGASVADISVDVQASTSTLSSMSSGIVIVVRTPNPTAVPTSLPTLTSQPPTPVPTHLPPEILWVGEAVNMTDMEVNPESKVTLRSSWVSLDVQTRFQWSVQRSTCRGPPLNLERGVTTATPLDNDILVLKAGVLMSGCAYTFSMEIVNRWGASHSAKITVVAGNPPTGGFMDVYPTAGITLRDTFYMETGNWTDDPESLPLSYSFVYLMPSGTQASLRGLSNKQNYSTVLQLGYGSSYILTLGAIASDVIGIPSTVNKNVTVGLPDPSEAISLVSNILNQSLYGGDIAGTVNTLQASSVLLTAVLSTDDNTSSIASSASNLRSTLIRETLSEATEIIEQTNQITSTVIETTLVAVESLGSTARNELEKADLEGLLTLTAKNANLTARLGTATPLAASATVKSISNVVSAGILEDDSGGSATAAIEEAVAEISSAITADMSPGEDPVDLVTENIAVSNLVVSSKQLRREDGFKVVSAMPELSTNKLAASFVLPGTLLEASQVGDNQEINIFSSCWAQNPFVSQDGSLPANSTVVGLTVGKIPIQNLSEPISLTLPRNPFVADTILDRRRLGLAAYGGLLEDGPLRRLVNCSHHPSNRPTDTMEAEKQSFCGIPPVYDPPHVEEVWCGDQMFNVTCPTNLSDSIIEFECPLPYTEGECR